MENKRKEKKNKYLGWQLVFLLPFAAAVFLFPTTAVVTEQVEVEATEAERAGTEWVETERVATEDVVVAPTSIGFLVTTVVSLLFTTACLLLGGSYLFFLFNLLSAWLNVCLVEVGGTYFSVCPFLDDLIWYRFWRGVGDIFFFCVLCWYNVSCKLLPYMTLPSIFVNSVVYGVCSWCSLLIYMIIPSISLNFLVYGVCITCKLLIYMILPFIFVNFLMYEGRYLM